jgi:hypothetical protein
LSHHFQPVLSSDLWSECLQEWQLTGLGIPLVPLKEPELKNHQAIEGELRFIGYCFGLHVAP